MSVRINQVQNYQTFKSEPQRNKDVPPKTHRTENVLIGGLTALGITTAAILAVKKGKKKDIIKTAEELTGKNPKRDALTNEEKEKLIKELQSKTDKEDVKAEIRKLVENGEWDKL